MGYVIGQLIVFQIRVVLYLSLNLHRAKIKVFLVSSHFHIHSRFLRKAFRHGPKGVAMVHVSILLILSLSPHLWKAGSDAISGRLLSVNLTGQSALYSRLSLAYTDSRSESKLVGSEPPTSSFGSRRFDLVQLLG